MTDSALVRELLARLREVKHRKGEITLDDITRILGGMEESFEKIRHRVDSKLKEEINEILGFLHSARTELASVMPQGVSVQHFTKATGELDEVIKATEEATNNILDAADEIQAATGGIDNEEIRAQIGAAVVRIFEASNFQDLTGQRITKVLTTISFLEEKMSHLITLVNNNEDPGTGDEDSLLNGPQSSNDAPSQDEIDALFASL